MGVGVFEGQGKNSICGLHDLGYSSVTLNLDWGSHQQTLSHSDPHLQ
jgi:hypothetical protein